MKAPRGRYRQSALDHFRLARSYAMDGDLARSAACYERALEDEPRFAEAVMNLGIVYHQMGTPHSQAALDCLRRAVELNSTSARAHYNLGVALASAQHTRQAARSFERTVEIRPGHKNALYALSIQWTKLGDDKRAAEYYRRYQRRMQGRPRARVRPPNLTSRATTSPAPLLVIRFIR